MENFEPNFNGGLNLLLVAADNVESPPRKRMGKEQGIILIFNIFSWLIRIY